MTHADLTYRIIGCAMRVHTELGPGLRESPYENALAIEFREQELPFAQQPRYPIFYHGQIVGDCCPDFVVDEHVTLELKSIDAIGEAEVAQVLNYLRIAKLHLGLVLNFKPAKLEIKRVAL